MKTAFGSTENQFKDPEPINPENLIMLVCEAYYFVDQKLCQLKFDPETKLYRFEFVDFPGVFHLNTDCEFYNESGNPVFNSYKIPYLIEQFILENGDYCTDFSPVQARKLLRNAIPNNSITEKQFTDFVDHAVDVGVISLCGAGLRSKWFDIALREKYTYQEFYNRYQNLIKIEIAELFV